MKLTGCRDKICSLRRVLRVGGWLMAILAMSGQAAKAAPPDEVDATARSINQLDQSYGYDGLRNDQGTAQVEGSSAADAPYQAGPEQVEPDEDAVDILQQATESEARQVSRALRRLNQGYRLNGLRSGHGSARQEGSSNRN